MFLEFLIAALLGITAGIFTGLIPGIHINLVSLLVVSVSVYLLEIFSLPSLGVFILSMAMFHYKNMFALYCLIPQDFRVSTFFIIFSH